MRISLSPCLLLAGLVLGGWNTTEAATWSYEAVRDPYADIVSHQAIGSGAQADGEVVAVALICERDQLAVVLREQTPLDVFGLIAVRYRFGEDSAIERTWVYGEGQASSFNDASAFAAAVVGHDSLRFQIGKGVERKLSLMGAATHVKRVLAHCGLE